MPGQIVKNSLLILLMNGKELQKSYKVDIKSLKGTDFIGVLDNVTVEWE